MGKFSGGGVKIVAPPPIQQPTAPPPPAAPTGPSPEAEEAARRARLAEKRRQGRRATLLVGEEGDENFGAVRRPSATAAPATFGG